MRRPGSHRAPAEAPQDEHFPRGRLQLSSWLPCAKRHQKSLFRSSGFCEGVHFWRRSLKTRTPTYRGGTRGLDRGDKDPSAAAASGTSLPASLFGRNTSFRRSSYGRHTLRRGRRIEQGATKATNSRGGRRQYVRCCRPRAPKASPYPHSSFDWDVLRYASEVLRFNSRPPPRQVRCQLQEPSGD